MTSVDKFNELELEFFTFFRSFEKKIRNLYSVIETKEKRPMSVVYMIGKLMAEEVISKDVGYDIKELAMYRNKIVHAEDLTNQERNMLESMIKKIKISEKILNEEFVIYTIKQYFSRTKYDIVKVPPTVFFDITVIEKENKNNEINFEIKNINSSTYSLYNQIISKNNDAISEENKIDKKYVTIIFSENTLNPGKNVEDFYRRNGNSNEWYFLFNFTEFDVDFAYECYDKVLELE